MAEKKKYNYMENTLNAINGEIISLGEENVKRNNAILREVLDNILAKLKENSLFKQIFRGVFFGGGYYDGLRIKNPDEFDLDLLFTLPKYAEPTLSISNAHGFVHLQLRNLAAFLKQPEAHLYGNFHNELFDADHYLDAKKVRSWMEGILIKALNFFDQNGKKIISTSYGSFVVSVVKGGPAMTLKIEHVTEKKIKMDIDLVPCFVFQGDKWPQSPFMKNPVNSKPEFFIVPKEPKSCSGADRNCVSRYWRLSFQEQEREMMLGKKTLKPTIKLFKQLRDNLGHHSIASYYIKTVALHIANQQPDEFWNSSLSYTFMTFFKEYLKFLEAKQISYYWNKNNNLLQGVNDARLVQIYSQLNKIYKEIEQNPGNTEIIIKHLAPKDGNEGLARRMRALQV